jgi:Zn-dependent protease with chaperone function
MWAVGALVGLVLAVGVALVVVLGAPPWTPAVLALAVVGLQYLVGPWLVQWLIPADVIDHDGERYLTDHPIGAIVARRCRDAGVPLVRLGIVDDGTPNAFAFGRTPRSARIWVTRGLLERLDERELDAVVAHEVGHVKHWDMVVMTVAAVVPLVFYYLYVTLRTTRRGEAQAVAVGAFVAYLVAQLSVLALSRARELAADNWSCRCTGDGEALASALVKVAYGIGEVDADRAAATRDVTGKRRKPDKEQRRADARARRLQTAQVLGIASQRDGKVLTTLGVDQGEAGSLDVRRAAAAMRWDRENPWGRVLEKLATHPLVTTRIDALARSGLPGAPVAWAAAADEAAAGVTAEERRTTRAGMLAQLVVAVAPWAVLVPALLLVRAGVTGLLGPGLLVGGLLLLVKQRVRYPFAHRRVDGVTSLLGRLDAGPVAGIPVEVHGRIVGRGLPGYVLSPDLVVADDGGFVPLDYQQPIRLLDSLFGLFRADRFLGRRVVARGWYLRGPGPHVELRDLVTVDDPEAPSGRRARAWMWAARHVASAVVTLAGIVVVLATAGT